MGSFELAGLTGRPPEFLGGFTAGAATGLIIGGFRRH